MSDLSAGQWVGGIVGGVIGAIYGGPVGAAQGFALGAGIGGYIDPPPGPNLKGPTLNDRSYQSSSYGASLPTLYGMIASTGNIFYLENNEYKAVSKKKKQGGKGGGGGTYETTTYFATFAISLSEANPGSAVIRIWAGGKLIYNAGEDGFFSSPENVSSSWKYYDGTQTEPDSRMEAVLGVGNCPSYEGTAYIMFYDFDLTEFGNGLQGCPMKVEISAAADEVPFRLIQRREYSFRADSNYLSRPICYFPYDQGANIACSYGLAGIYQRKYTLMNVEADGNIRQTYGGLDPAIILGMPGAEVGYSAYIFSYSYYEIDPLRLKSGININGASYENGYKNYPALTSAETANIMRVYSVNRIGGINALFKTSGQPISDASSPAANTWFFTGISNGGAIYGDIGFVGSDPGVVAWDGNRIVRIFRTSANNYIARIFTNAGTLGPSSDINFTLPFDRVLTYQYAAKFLEDTIYCVPVEASDLASGDVHLFTLNLITTDAEYHLLNCPDDADAVSNPTLNVISSNAIAIGYRTLSNSWGVMLFSSSQNENDVSVPLADICDDAFDASGIPPEHRDFTEILPDYVSGYAVSAPSSGRGMLQQLQVAFLFDLIEAGYKISAKKRENSAADPIEIDYKNLCYSDGAAIKTTSESNSILPSRYTIKYIDRLREYDTMSQSAEYPCNFNNLRSEDLAVVFDADTAATIAEKLINLSWIESRKCNFKLPQPFLGIRLGDHAIIERQGGTKFVMRVEQISRNNDQTIDVSGSFASGDVYSIEAAGANGQAPTNSVIKPIGGTDSMLVDAPMVADLQNKFGFVMSPYGGGDGWPGAVLQRSVDNGQNYSSVVTIGGEGGIGQALNTLTVNSGLVVDYISQLQYWPITDQSPPSYTEEIMMTGKNYIAYGVHGRWEICQYASAQLQADGSYILSTLIRGMRGTEWATGIHEINDYIVLLDDADNVFVDSDAVSIGVSRKFKTITFGQDASLVQEKNFTYGAANLKPLAPVSAIAARVANDWIISASERSRFSSSFWHSGLQPVRDNQLFAIDIFKSGLVIRTIQSSSLSFTYTSAQQVEDFGSNQSAITIDIYQISESVGAGFKLRITA